MMLAGAFAVSPNAVFIGHLLNTGANDAQILFWKAVFTGLVLWVYCQRRTVAHSRSRLC